MKDVLKKLEITEDTLSVITYNTGLAFARHYCTGIKVETGDTIETLRSRSKVESFVDEDAVNMLTGCRAYWDWWRSTMERQATAFLHLHANTRTNTRTLHFLFEGMLRPGIIHAQPCKHIIRQSLDKLWSEAFRNEYKSVAALPLWSREGAAQQIQSSIKK